MPFPAVEARQASTDSTSSSADRTVTLPSGIVSGELLYMHFGALGVAGGTTPNTPSGWTQVFSHQQQNAVTGVFWRRADGTEGSSVTVTVTNNIDASWATVWRISDAGDPDSSIGFATSTGTTPDPGSVTPAGGLDDYLFIAGYVMNGGGTATGFPANYSDGQSIDEGSTHGGVAERELNASSEDPGAFSTSASSARWVAIVNDIPHLPAAINNDRLADMAFCRGRLPLGPGQLPIPDGTIS